MMRIAALEEGLRAKTPEELEAMVAALDVLCNKLPEQLIQEMGLRTLRDLVKLQVIARARCKKEEGKPEGGTKA